MTTPGREAVVDHGQDCPACRAAPLTDEDRKFLTQNGWEQPKHIVAPALMDPEPWPPLTGQEGLILLAVLMVPTILMAIWAPLGLTAFVCAVAAYLGWAMTHPRRHRQHIEGCYRCRVRAHKAIIDRWQEYRRLVAVERARLRAIREHQEREARALWHQANYERLVQQQRREGGL